MTYLKRSPWIMHYAASSCNGCGIEVLACLTPLYDVERFGIINTGNPKHADILVVSGSVNEQNKSVLQNLYSQMPDPKVVVAVGICAASGGVFHECYNVMGGIDKIIPVDVYVPGCAARPEAIIDGVVIALGVLEEKYVERNDMLQGKQLVVIDFATEADAEKILEMQKLAFRSEAEIHNNFSIEPLVQTLDDIKHDFCKKTMIKAVMNGTIVGSVRAYIESGVCHIGRLMVDPRFQNRGIGTQLMLEIERIFLKALKWEIFTGYKSKRTINLYKKLGYTITRTERFSDDVKRVFLEKENHSEREQ